VCDICRKPYASQGWLDRHISTHHNGNVQFSDPVVLHGGFETEVQVIEVNDDVQDVIHIEEYREENSDTGDDFYEDLSNDEEPDDNGASSNANIRRFFEIDASGADTPEEDYSDTLLTRGQRHLSLKMFP
jgi:hypothetical protein